MIKTITEIIPARKIQIPGNKYVKIPKHSITLSYNTQSIKDMCVDCGGWIEISEKRYLSKGNYCDPCSIKYSQAKFVDEEII